MKKIILSCAAALLAIGSAHATPKFLSLNNKHGKTTIIIEIPASDRDETNGLSIEDVVLYNSGKTFQAKSVDAIWGDNSTVILQFEKLTAFDDCRLSFSLNGEPVSLVGGKRACALGMQSLYLGVMSFRCTLGQRSRHRAYLRSVPLL